MAARLLTALFALVMLASSMVPPSGLLSNDASAESLPSWTRTFHLHEGAVYSTSYYDWLNSSGPYNPSWADYDGDGSMGISIRKWNPSEHWRHFWVLDPAVNSQVQILGDMSAYVWAKSRDNESATLMTVIFSDCAPGQLADPSLWTEIGTVTIPLQGPIYSEFKLYNATVAGVDYLLDPDHQLVMTIRRGDSLNDALQVMYDQNIYDSYIRFPTTTFISADAVWTEDSTGSARSVFSDGEDVTVLANVSNPFGTYEIVGVDAEVAYSSNSTVVLGPVSMTLSRTDTSSNPAWSVFSTLLVGLENGTYDITIRAYDPQGSPTWLSCSIYVVTADHFAVSAPSSVLVDTAFTMTVSARDASDAVIPNWVGTVSLASYLEDAVSPSAGSLSVTSVDITASDGGQVTDTGSDVRLRRGDDTDQGEQQLALRLELSGHCPCGAGRRHRDISFVPRDILGRFAGVHRGRQGLLRLHEQQLDPQLDPRGGHRVDSRVRPYDHILRARDRRRSHHMHRRRDLRFGHRTDHREPGHPSAHRDSACRAPDDTRGTERGARGVRVRQPRQSCGHPRGDLEHEHLRPGDRDRPECGLHGGLHPRGRIGRGARGQH